MKISKSHVFQVLITTICIIAFMNVEAQSQEGYIKKEEVPLAVLEKLDLLYPELDEKLITWEYENKGYEGYIGGNEKGACFFSEKGNLEFRIYTDEKGLRIKKHKEISAEVLPKTIFDHSKGKNILFIIEELDPLNTTLGYILYTKNNGKLAYNEKGEPIQYISN